MEFSSFHSFLPSFLPTLLTWLILSIHSSILPSPSIYLCWTTRYCRTQVDVWLLFRTSSKTHHHHNHHHRHLGSWNLEEKSASNLSARSLTPYRHHHDHPARSFIHSFIPFHLTSHLPPSTTSSSSCHHHHSFLYLFFFRSYTHLNIWARERKSLQN